MKIIIAVDDSRHSKAAVEFVRKMTWPADTEFLVLSVAQAASAVYAELYLPATLPAELTEDLARVHEGIAADAMASLQASHGRTRTKVVHGDPRTAITDLAREEHADLVVVGSHGRTGLAKMLMGSVAQHVMTHASCSVLVVKLEKR